MKVSLHLEYLHLFGGLMYRNVGTGLLSSYRNQKKLLEKLKIPYDECFDGSADILQINLPWLSSLFAASQAKRKGKKVVMWAHTTMEDALQVFRFTKYLKKPLRRYLTYAYGQADRVFCPSSYTKALLLAYGLPEEKLLVLSNGVDTDTYCPNPILREGFRKEYGLQEVVIGTIGLVIPRKGTDTFIELAVLLPKQQFLWCGSTYSGLIAEKLPATLPKNVYFTGFIPDAVAALNAFDIFIFPSYEENQGMAILEAAAVGLPIIVRDLPVYRDWLFDAENCLKATDTASFEKAIKRILDDTTLRDRLIEGSFLLAKQESTDRLSERLLQVYADL